MEAFVELNQRGDRANVYFRYDMAAVEAIKRIPGRRFIVKNGGEPAHWTLPLDLVTMRHLREEFGSGLRLGPRIKIWGQAQVRQEKEIRAVVAIDDIPLKELKLSKKLPKFAKWLRPYQRADIKFMATTSCLNLLEPRLGKTTEVIGAVFESDLEDGRQLVVAPKSALDTVWKWEVERWADQTVITWHGDLSTAEKASAIVLADQLLGEGTPFWFATTADMIRRSCEILEMIGQWNTFTIDEFHKTGLAETKNVFPKKAAEIEAERKWAMSGTPMGGKPIKLWGALHWVKPDQYTSKWTWAGRWLEIETGWGNHKTIKGILPGREDAFYEHLAHSAVRRLRSEVLPQLPEKQWIDVWYSMTPKQAKQYRQFEADAEIRIDEYHLSATSVLAEYTRLKQFANSFCEVEVIGYDEETGATDLKLKATPEAGVIEPLLDRLAEVGIDPADPAGTAQAIVASQFRETADMIYDVLTEKGIKCAKITGPIKQKERNRIQNLFKDDGDRDGYRVVVMTTTAGGVAITLNNCESVHIIDETWNPDDQEQVSDRGINTETNHQVNVFVYRARGTIMEYIYGVTTDKREINTNILDVRRRMFKERERSAA